MSIRSITVVLLSIFCGASAVIGINRLSQYRQESAMKVTATTPIVVAVADIPAGRVIKQESLAMKQWPNEMLPGGAIKTLDDAVGRTTLNPVFVGEPLVTKRVAAPGVGPGLAARLKVGERAYTIQCSQAKSNVAGFIAPESLVDVNLTYKSSQADEAGGVSSFVLLQAITVLAVDQHADAMGQRSQADLQRVSSVTLLVTPEQESILALAQDVGTLSLALRNPEDTEIVDTQVATFAKIRLAQMMASDQGPAGGEVAQAAATLPEVSTTPKPVPSEAVAVGEDTAREDAARPARKPRPAVIHTLRGGSHGYVQIDFSR
jgi:pilus assembly protein CpaB